MGSILPEVLRSYLASGKVKDFLQSCRLGYKVRELEFSLGLLGVFKEA